MGKKDKDRGLLGGIFDFNGDGKTDLGEEWIAYLLFQEFSKELDRHRRAPDPDPDIISHPSPYAWRENCEDGEDYGVDPEDYETEKEYEEAIEEARHGWRRGYESRAEYAGLDITAYETREEFLEAEDQAFKLRRDERLRQINESREREERARASRRRFARADPEAAADPAVYTFCGVIFQPGGMVYHYRTDDETLAVGERVVVPVGSENRETSAEIVSVEKHRRSAAPYPVDRAKFIIRRAEDGG